MKKFRVVMLSTLMVLLCRSFSPAQQNVATTANATVPPLIQFSNIATDEVGNTLSGVVNITFSLYSGQQGGEALWTETQNNVQVDPMGHYAVQLGVTKSNGMPTSLFTTGEARWLGVRIAEQTERPRVLLLSVPYALKAADAATIGGLPPSAFVLAAPGTTAGSSAPSTFVAAPADAPAGSDVTGSGTADFIPLWTTTSNIADSVLFQSGSGTTAKIGVNTTTPASTLDVKGGGTIRGTLSLPTAGTATATKGFNSQPLTLAASAFNSTTSTSVNQTFQWQAEPAGNDTTAPSGTLNLLFGEGAAKPFETGLHISSDGQITFAAGQTFPGTGTGDGTITSVTAGTDLTGGGTTGSVTLNVDTTKIPQLAAANTFTANQTVNGTVTATSFSGSGSGLTNVTAANSNELGGLASSAFAQLAANNTFSGTQTVNNTVTMTGTNSSGVLQVTNTTTSSSAAPGIVGTTESTNASGVKGVASAATGGSNGVYGKSSSTGGYGVRGTSLYAGVYGQSNSASSEGVSIASDFDGFGVWGDTGGAAFEFSAVLGTADDNTAAGFYNNSNCCTTLIVSNDEGSNSGDDVFYAFGGGFGGNCSIDVSGDLDCNGTVTGVVPADGGARKLALYAMQSPENWFEDFGSGSLSNGAAMIALDPTFTQTVNTGIEYHVFLTPKGDSEGLYVSNETPQGFEVHEQRGGHSSVAFDYRIVAKRVGYENVRLADLTEHFKKQEAQRNRMRRPLRPSAAPQASPDTSQPPLRAVTQSLAARPK